MISTRRSRSFSLFRQSLTASNDFDRNGLDLAALGEHIRKHRVLRSFSTELAFDPDELLVQRCDILVPAALAIGVETVQRAKRTRGLFP